MSTIKDFNQAKEILYGYIPKQPNVTKYNLDNTRRLMDALGNPQEGFKTIHVAGTSGKTSTCYYTAALLKNAGYKVGVTVSPHVDEINERVQIGLVPMPEPEYCQELGQFIDIIEDADIQPSYFELLIGFAYWIFSKQKVDYAVVEVGLGGLLDGTNVINREDKVCVITDIGLDHTKILGDKLDQIALQKAGIIHENNAVFMNEQNNEVKNVIRKRCDEHNTSLNIIHPNQHPANLSDLPTFQIRNIQLAIAAVNYTLSRDFNRQLTNSDIDASKTTYVPARMEVARYKDKVVIMDGSHNEQKIGALIDAIKTRYPGKTVTLLVGFGENKQTSVIESMKLLQMISNDIILTTFSIGQDELRASIGAEDLATYAEETGFAHITTESNPQLALELLTTTESDICLVTGSFYLLNEIRPLVLGSAA
jgi:dihydrofolate synthase/folylpolyglutamate synthase